MIDVEESQETLKKKKRERKKIKRKKNKTSSGSSLLVFSGGTAMNGICDALRDYDDPGHARASGFRRRWVDFGNYSSFRWTSRRRHSQSVFAFIRRIYARSHRGEGLLAHRLHPTDEELAKNEWYKIQEGDSPLWDGIDNAYATIIRRFLVHFHTEVTTNTHKERFAFVNGSIGNFFFAGSRMFFRSDGSCDIFIR